MTPETLHALAERCEKASGPDRELDAEIMRLFTNSVESDDGDWWYGPHDEMPRKVPAFTASLDAALTLVPEGWRVNSADWSILGQISWMLRGPCKTNVMGPDGYEEAGDDWFKVGTTRTTPALALCAAALRARAVQP